MATAQELIDRLRSEFLDDVEGAAGGDAKWSNADLVSALNWSERELARRLLLITDAESALCTLSVAAVDSVYPRSYALDTRILKVLRLRYSGVTRPLIKGTRAWLDQDDSGWDEKAGVPQVYVLDRGRITFNRQPEADATVTLTVQRLPLAPLAIADLSASPELSELDDELCHGALVRAYLKDDHQTFDPLRSRKWEAVFEEDIKRLTREKSELSPDVRYLKPEPW